VFGYLFNGFFEFAWSVLKLRCLTHSFYNGSGMHTSCDRFCDRAFAQSGLLRSGALPCDRLAIVIG
jgi:hypothetical protein